MYKRSDANKDFKPVLTLSDGRKEITMEDRDDCYSKYHVHSPISIVPSNKVETISA
jgi:hypothetical protein